MDNILGLQAYIPSQKAQGMVAEIYFHSAMRQLYKNEDVFIIDGCWLLSNSDYGANKNRLALFSVKNDDELSILINKGGRLFDLLRERGIDSHIVNHHNFNNVSFFDTATKEESLTPSFNIQRSGRVSNIGANWNDVVIKKMSEIPAGDAESHILHTLTYYKVLKNDLRAKFSSVHDLDGFIVTKDTIIPFEIKEKSRTSTNWFGIDIGRILCFLKIGLGGLYIVREVAQEEPRNFIGWKVIDFQDIIHNCEWNVVEGGSNSLARFRTHTVAINGDCFNRLNKRFLLEKGVY